MTKLPAPVIARQLERTDLNHGPIGTDQKATLIAAGAALQQAGVIAAERQRAGDPSTSSSIRASCRRATKSLCSGIGLVRGRKGWIEE